MSESAPPNPSVVVGRKSKRKRSDDDLRQERKREADRMAQKISREKRKLYTDQLERTIKILSKEDGRAATRELMEEISLLRAENGRLRKIIDSVKSAVLLKASNTPYRSRKSVRSHLLLIYIIGQILLFMKALHEVLEPNIFQMGM
jgi:regulator of replication initiation timing